MSHIKPLTTNMHRPWQEHSILPDSSISLLLIEWVLTPTMDVEAIPCLCHCQNALFHVKHEKQSAGFLLHREIRRKHWLELKTQRPRAKRLGSNWKTQNHCFTWNTTMNYKASYYGPKILDSDRELLSNHLGMQNILAWTRIYKNRYASMFHVKHEKQHPKITNKDRFKNICQNQPQHQKRRGIWRY